MQLGKSLIPSHGELSLNFPVLLLLNSFTVGLPGSLHSLALKAASSQVQFSFFSVHSFLAEDWNCLEVHSFSLNMHACMCTHTCMHLCTHEHAHAYVHTHACTYAHTSRLMHTRTHMHTYAYIHLLERFECYKLSILCNLFQTQGHSLATTIFQWLEWTTLISLVFCGKGEIPHLSSQASALDNRPRFAAILSSVSFIWSSSSVFLCLPWPWHF